MITKQQIKDTVTAFRQANTKAKLTQGNKSSIYQLIIDDFNSRKEGPVSRRRYNTETKPDFVAPAKYSSLGKRRTEILWPCEMIAIDSSWIEAVGYNADQKVMKLQTGKYTYAYQDVPEAAYRTFFTTNSAGRYYASFRKLYRAVALV